MITVEGYKAFRGVLRVTPKSGAEPFELYGDFLYKPEYNCWYGRGRSFHESICEVLVDETVPVMYRREET